MKKKTALPDDEKFCRAIKALREAKGWSQSRLADELNKVGLTEFYPATVRRIELGERPVRLGEAAFIAEALDSSLVEMLWLNLDDPKLQLLDDLKRWTQQLERGFEELVGQLDDLSTARRALFAYFSMFPFDEEQADDFEHAAHHAVLHYTVWNAALESHKRTVLKKHDDESAVRPGSSLVLDFDELSTGTSEDMGILPYLEAKGLQVPESLEDLKDDSTEDGA